jgi:hypothetical protein
MTYKIQKIEPNGVVYADPATATSVRFRNTSTSKTLNGAVTKNQLTELIYNDDNAVVVGGINSVDAVSVRLRVSASPASQARVKQILLAMAAQITTWEDEDVFMGFNPVTAPVIPNAV